MNAEDSMNAEGSMNAEDSMNLARRFIGLPLEKRQMFLQALQREGLEFSRFPIPAGVEAEDRQALSYAQQRMWFLWHLDPASAAYNLPGAVRLKGVLNRVAMEQAFASLVARHETLRTVFRRQADDRLVQVTAEPAQAIALTDLTHLAPAEREQAVAAAATGQAQQPFDLASGPLLRIELLKLAEQEHVLLLTLHHIVSDGWSMNVLIDEFIRCYDAHERNQSPQLPALPIQYSDYALWQRRWLEAGEQARQQEYWRARLGDEHPVLELPTDYPRPAMPSHRGTRHGFAIDAALTEQLRACAQKHQVTLFMLLLGAFNILLHRYTGQSDIRVGVPIANRNRSEVEGLIGFFVNTQVLRTQLNGQTPVDQLLVAIKEAALGAQAHQDLPFERLVEALNVERSLSHTPLFQVMYNHQPQVADVSSLSSASGLQLSQVQWQARTTQFDLTLDTFEQSGTLHAALTYADDLFAPATIERMAGHWLRLLHGIVADSRQTVSQLPLLDSAEYQRIVHDWNAGDLQFPQDRCIHSLISAQAQAMPGALAVTFGATALTYAQLEHQANQLAHRLIALGIGPEVRVGVAMNRSEALLVALLAVLKAGGAYVPLDPDYPAERVAYMLEDSQARLLLTEQAVARGLPVIAGTQLLLLDELAALLVGYPGDAPATHVSPDNLAYVIYTSGSTGKPKGVAIAHRNVLALIDWSRQVYRQDDIQGVLASTSVCFDLSVWELFVTLACGGSLIIARNALELPDLPARDRVRLINSVPSAIAALQRTGQIPPGVRIINLAGEPLKQSLVEALYQQPGIEHVYDLYGPSEDTTYSTYTRRTAGGRANIGRPIHHTASYLLDADLQVVPQGVCAELYLAGAGITRGYLGRAALTAERYVPNPFGADGQRLYRSGDLVRYQDGGVLEYQGRIDHQVKVRGFRIELGEIEARLLQQEQVRELAVLAQDGLAGPQLVAYIVPTDAALLADLQAQGAARESLKAALKHTLPAYMVPSHLLFLPGLPLTPNGKLDRKALPAIDAAQNTHAHVEPVSALEKSLAAIWQDVLGLGQVGVEDNFFELGGDSIVAMQVVSRARQAAIALSPKDLFLHQTIRSLAQVAGQSQHVVIEQAAVSGEAALSPVQQRFFAQAIAQRQHWNQSLLLVPREPVVVATLDAALHQLLMHHDALRLRFLPSADGWRQQYSAPATAALLWHRRADDADALLSLCDEAQRSLDLHHGPLMRALLVEMPDQSQRLLLVVHHLVVDGVSWRVLLEDLQQLYTGLGVALPQKTSSYQAWTARLQHALPRFLEQLEGWQARLAHAAHADLPCDNRHGVLHNSREHKVSCSLDVETTRQLLSLAPAAYRTQVNDLLLTALARVVCRWSGQGSALIELEGHGREDLFDSIDLTRTVGWFTSLFPVNLVPSAELGDSIKAIKEQLRAVPDKGLGYGVLRYLALPQIQAQLAALPQPRITFNYLGQFDRQFDHHALFVPAGESGGQAQDPQAPLANWLTVEGQVYGGQLALQWGFSLDMFKASSIQRLADDYAVELQALIAHCCATTAGQVTPSDFPLASLTAPQLAALPVDGPAIDDIYPLSPMQQGMLFHSLYEPQAQAYINQLRLDIDGLDVLAFGRAWQAALDRHDILRSSFHWLGLDSAHQVIHRQADVQLQVIEDVGADLDRLADAERERGFELSRAPLFRLMLVRGAGSTWHLIYTSHHILMDGWSNAQLLGEVISHYAGQALPAPQGQFHDYLGWLAQQSPLAGQTFWKATLAPLLAPTLLAEALRLPVGETGMAEHPVNLDTAHSQALGDFARQQKVTLNTLLQGAWSLLLQRYTGQDCVAFGATVAGRSAPLPGIEQQLGLFINTLPIVSHASPAQPVGAWLGDLQSLNLSLRDHEHVPLYDIQAWAGQQGSALFDTLLVFENFPVAAALKQGAPAGLLFGRMHNHERTNYPLTLGVELGTGLRLDFSYDRARFSDAQVRQLSANLLHLLAQMVADAHACLGTLQLLDAPGRRRLLGFSQPPALGARNALWVHERIAAMAQATPEALAVQAGNLRLNYRELDQHANRLAHRLLEQGIGPGQRVGLAARRGPHLIVSLLAVLKSAATYVPLDPNYPAERLAFMLADSRLDLLLCETGLLQDLALAPGLARLEFSPGGGELAGYSAGNPPNRAVAADLAYVIYTSGSTGQPKGVAIDHAALGQFCESAEAYSGLTPQDRVLQFATFSFDGFVEQCYPPLCAGAALIMRGDELWDASQLAREIVEQGVTLADLPAAYWYLLAKECARDGRSLGQLRQVHVGGEAMSVEGVRVWHAAGLGAVRLLNTYGPTEASVVSSVHECQLVDASDTFGVPIGRAIDGRALYVLDTAFQLLPTGAVGELWIGAMAGLAQGYFDRPALSAERFVPDPFAGVPGARLYRSGDLARCRDDGVIEYVGRVDHQVKIRGYRIETGEIEARLMAQASVREACVMAQGDGAGQHLVAYIVATETSPDPQRQAALRDAIRQALKRQVPDYMVPNHWVLLEAMPLTPNGKLDRKALPAVDSLVLQRAFQAPETPLQQRIALIWREVLNVAQVGLQDNFFDLGGHSLLVTQVVSRIRHELNLDLPLRTLFESSHLQDFVAALAEANSAAQVPRLQRVDDTQPQPLSFAQQRLWFLWQLEPESSMYNIPNALRLHGALDPSAVLQAFELLLQRHSVLRTRFFERDGESWQQVQPHIALPFEFTDLSLLSDAERELTVDSHTQQAAQAPFDLREGPLLRVHLLRVGADEHCLLVTLHHIVADHWSFGILLNEFAAAYAALRAGHTPQLPQPTLQYIDFAVWQRHWLEHAEMARQLDWWRATLGDDHRLTTLPPSSGARLQPRGLGLAEVHGFRFSLAQSEALRAFATARGLTLYMLLLAGFAVVLAQRCGTSRVRLGTDIANRNHAGVEDMVGFFVNQLVMQISVEERLGVEQLLKACRAMVIGASDHQDLPFDRLVEALRVPRRAGKSPLFDIKFIYQEAAAQTTTISGLQLVPGAVGKAAAELDLIAEFVNDPEGIYLALKGDAGLYSAADMACLFEQLQALFGALMADPQGLLAPLLAEAREIHGAALQAQAAQREELLTQHHPISRRRPSRQVVE